MKYETGDVLTTRGILTPLVQHKGVVVVEDDGIVWVYHTSIFRTNEYGGTIVKDPLDVFAQNRELLSVYRSGVSREQIEAIVDLNREQEFHLFLFNCEHFAYLVKTGEKRSPQLLYWSLGLGAIVSLFLFAKYN